MNEVKPDPYLPPFQPHHLSLEKGASYLVVSEALDGNVVITKEDFLTAEQEATRFISGMNLTCWHQLRWRAWKENGSGGVPPEDGLSAQPLGRGRCGGLEGPRDR